MGKSAFPLKKILILVTILAVPGFLYYMLEEKGQNRYRPLGIFGPKKVASTFHSKRGKKIPDTVYHTISNFKLLNQEADTVIFPSATNQITLFNFFFTRCPSFCPAMNRQMARVANLYRQNELLQFYSITVDPGHDSPLILSKYASQYTSKGKNWDFLTGNKELIFKLAKQDLLVDALPDTSMPVNFIHSPMLILVDPQKRIRGYYDSGDVKRVDVLIDEIKVLITEELRNVKDGR